MDNLDYIRSTMERASAFTAVPGWGNVGIGCTALGAAWIAAGQASEPAFLLVWLAEAVLALSIALWSMKRKARIHQIPLLSGPGAKFWRGLGPPFLAGFLLTIGLFKAGQYLFLPGPFIPHDVHVEVADNLRSSEHIGLTLHLGGHPQVHDRTNAAGDELIHASNRDPVHLSGSQESPPTRLVSISGRVPPEISNVGAPFQINVSIGMQEFVHQ
ncbi:MAG: hypothetical protein VCE12_05670 [Candidatus Latescibacterota bacterium]